MATVPLPRDAGASVSTTLPAALELAAKGWAVIPLHYPTGQSCSCGKPECTSPGKHPRTRNGSTDASKDPRTIRAWWKKWHTANVGIATGRESGLCVLDVDGEDGLRSLEELTRAHGFPETLRVLTGRRNQQGERAGFHLYFRLPEGMCLRNSAGSLGRGLDVRGEGGYVVAPPSLHSSGLHYEWQAGNAPMADVPAWLRLEVKRTRPALELAGAKSKKIPAGQRNNKLTSVAGKLRNAELTQDAIEAALMAENKRLCEPPLPAAEVRRIAASVARYPLERQTLKTERRPNLVCLADVEAKPVSWLWEPYIPLGMTTILSGDPGVGKTFLALSIAAKLSLGEYGGAGAEPGNTLFLTVENSPEYVIRPRFDAQRGDVKRFYIMQGSIVQQGETERPGTVNLSDTDQLETAVPQSHARLLVIDPLQSFLGAAVDSHRSNETRPILDGLTRIAETFHCAILLVRHLSKGQSGRSIHRGLGSIDITAAARSELIAAPHPADPNRRIMAHSKSNLGKLGDSREFTISADGQFLWGGKSELTADEILRVETPSQRTGAKAEAEEFLRDELADGPVASKDIDELARRRGISEGTLRRAKISIGIKPSPDGFGKPWVLSLPSVALKSPELFNGEK